MKKILMVLALLALFVAAQAQQLSGAGASFPAPAYADWADKYNQETGVQINYQAIGSSGGIKQITAKNVLFGGSDSPLKAPKLQEEGLVQFPMILGGVVPVYNIDGFNADLRLDGATLADIFLGKIRNWNDRRIAALNPGVKLPSQYITVVRRSDGSGTTFLFSSFLGAVSADWNNGPGVGKALKWPTGVGGKGNAGVAGYVKQINGSIGYVEYAYAKKENLAMVSLKNRSGNFVQPGPASVAAAAANAQWDPAQGYYLVLANQPGNDSWPIAGASFILIHKDQPDAAQAQEALKFFKWAFSHGEVAEALGYVAIPQNVVKMIENTWSQEMKGPDGKALWPAM